MNREPVAIVGTITGIVTALIALFVAFGLDLNRDQQTAILGVVAAVAPLVAAYFARRRVTPVE